MRRFFALLIATGASFVAASVVFSYKPRIELQFPHAQVEGRTVEILAARGQLMPGQLITKGDVIWVEWPQFSLPNGALASVESLFGPEGNQRRMAMSPIEKGDLILARQISELLPPKVHVPYPPPGMRAIGVPTEAADEREPGGEYGDASSLRPGDTVAISLIRDVPGHREPRIVVENAQVLAVLPASRAGQSGDGIVVIVAVTTAQAQRLSVAMQVGVVSLIKRSEVPHDDVAPLELMQTCGPPPEHLPNWVLYPDDPSAPGGRMLCARKLPGVDERPRSPLLRRYPPGLIRIIEDLDAR